TNAGNRKRRAKKAFKVLFFIIILAALVFVGYSVAQPVFEYFGNRNENSAENDVSPWTPPVSDNGENSDDTGENTDNTDDTDSNGNDEPVRNENIRFSAYQLPVTALSSTDALTAALNSAKEGGYTAIAVTLKDKGGKIYYKTTSEMAVTDETAVIGELYSGQICSMIKAAGFTPIARVNILEDNNRYGANREGAFRFAGSNSTWLDNSVENGGKPWLSPFDTDTQSYAAYIANEVSSSGFEYVIFDGLVFPPFRNSDLNIVGDIVKSAYRYKALINIANISINAAQQNNVTAAAMLSAGGIIDGTAEAFKPAELGTDYIAVSYTLSEIPNTAVINGEEVALSDMAAYDKAETVLGEIKRLAGEDKMIIPVIRQAEFSQADFSDTISAVMSIGCDSYVIL
ncbi:MAG: hypothetical protein K2H23_01665, partial [Oscillospiraceae bacterium]|nr:hypothetical protein [Oscillospiraceae bacterium]